MARYVVLGGYGGMGSVCVKDLFETAKGATIVIAGRDLKKAKAYASTFRSRRVKAADVDVTNVRATARLLKGADVCINAVQYYYNLDVMRACLKARVNYVDLGGLYHVTLKQLKLNAAFAKIGKVAVLGCGSTPGITNVMAAYGGALMERVHRVHIRFGDKDYTNWGVPFVVPYSMDTVFDEFTMKPAIFMNGKHRLVSPRSGESDENFPSPVGKLRSFRILHSELATLPAHFKRKGIRDMDFKAGFPQDFVDKVDFLVDLGFASIEQVVVGSKSVRLRDVIVAVLNKPKPSPRVRVMDVEMLVVELVGKSNGKNVTVRVFCKAITHDNISAGTWDTGTPPSIIAQMVARGLRVRGVMAPETAVPSKPFFKELKKRGIHVYTEVRKHDV
ncbi:MAG: saccharopine dehydrogenase NADP-binding domain-containing protein [Candidatus Aenigmatarchaeota archaeon]|nr:MAG: saccharopine dehydrogenase NADP-binding domain-containing protein [Candidatus Aenigmarchaeota archaeon]